MYHDLRLSQFLYAVRRSSLRPLVCVLNGWLSPDDCVLDFLLRSVIFFFSNFYFLLSNSCVHHPVEPWPPEARIPVSWSLGRGRATSSNSIGSSCIRTQQTHNWWLRVSAAFVSAAARLGSIFSLSSCSSPVVKFSDSWIQQSFQKLVNCLQR